MTKMLAKIDVDMTRCGKPLECAKCLQICPTRVLVVNPSEVARGKLTAPDNYRITGLFYNDCSGCMACADICPKDAVKVTFQTKEERFAESA